MNKFYLISALLSSFVVFSQNDGQKNSINSSYKIEDVQFLRKQIDSFQTDQNAKIHSFVKHNGLEKDFSLQRIIDGVPVRFRSYNDGSAKTIRANALYPGGSLGLSVTGEGLTAGVWDGGRIRSSHQELSGNVTVVDLTGDLNVHATHVSGTIIGKGISPLRRGMAYQGSVRGYNWDSDYSEMNDFALAGYLMSNHSYGYVATNLPLSFFGSYNTDSRQVDLIANTFPYYQMVFAAGNDRNNFDVDQVNIKGGYDLLTGKSNSKNGLVVAAVEEVLNYTNSSSVVMSSFSNYGPTDDGRIKPDISAKGIGVSSCGIDTNTDYDTLNGTSMATPAITGLIMLLQKHYSNLNAGSFMKSASVRGLICHTAREAGLNLGPDYEFGWGLADGYSAAQLLSQRGTSSVLQELTLSNQQTRTSNFTLNTTQNVKISIAWTDPAGNISSGVDNRTPRLINNLDLRILKDGNTFYSWKLDPESPSDAATNNADNNVDNIERVEIFNATPGTYTIQVSHKGSLQGGSQDYTLIATSTNGLTLASEDFVADNNFFVYPSPANETISYSNPNSYAINSISIADISGKQVLYLGESAITDTINVANLQSGVYFVTFTTGNSTTVKKFIKN